MHDEGMVFGLILAIIIAVIFIILFSVYYAQFNSCKIIPNNCSAQNGRKLCQNMKRNEHFQTAECYAEIECDPGYTFDSYTCSCVPDSSSVYMG